MTTPAMAVSSRSAPDRSPDGTEARAEPAANADALVVTMTMSLVLWDRPPATGAAKQAYRPCTGLTPASTLAAMPSGTLLIAPGSPARASWRRVLSDGTPARALASPSARTERDRSCQVTVSPFGAVGRVGSLRLVLSG